MPAALPPPPPEKLGSEAWGLFWALGFGLLELRVGRDCFSKSYHSKTTVKGQESVRNVLEWRPSKEDLHVEPPYHLGQLHCEPLQLDPTRIALWLWAKGVSRLRWESARAWIYSVATSPKTIRDLRCSKPYRALAFCFASEGFLQLPVAFRLLIPFFGVLSLKSPARNCSC